MTLFGYAVTPIMIAGVGVVVTAVGGAQLTKRGAWYATLRKPSWEPPDWLFGPVWSTIFLLWAASFVLAWTATTDPAEHLRLVGIYAANAGLNVFWSYLFFTRHRPDLALIETVPFLASIAVILFAAAPLDASAAWLTVPYLLWVAFAACLNAAIVRLNSASRTFSA